MIILGLDGLDLDLVYSFGCRNLFQETYGSISVPVHSVLKVPVTPQVWGSFLTGQWLGDLGFTYGSAWMDRVVSLLRQVKRIVPVQLGLTKRIVHEPKRFPPLPYKTFADRIDIDLMNVPFYNFDHWIFNTGFELTKDRISLSEFLLKLVMYFNQLTAKVTRAVDSMGPHLFAYLPFPDIVHHFCYHDRRIIAEHYRELEEFIAHIEKRTDGPILIVSDHGFDFQTKRHSLKGGFSLNRPLYPAPKRITEFYSLILNGSFNDSL